MVRVVGVEPTRISPQEPKSCASANSAIPAGICPQNGDVAIVTSKRRHVKLIIRRRPAHTGEAAKEADIMPKHREKARRRGCGACRRLGILLCELAVLAAVGLGWVYSSLPDTIYVEQGQQVQLARLPFLRAQADLGARDTAATGRTGSFNTTLSIEGLLPVKTVHTMHRLR